MRFLVQSLVFYIFLIFDLGALGVADWSSLLDYINYRRL